MVLRTKRQWTNETNEKCNVLVFAKLWSSRRTLEAILISKLKLDLNKQVFSFYFLLFPKVTTWCFAHPWLCRTPVISNFRFPTEFQIIRDYWRLLINYLSFQYQRLNTMRQKSKCTVYFSFNCKTLTNCKRSEHWRRGCKAGKHVINLTKFGFQRRRHSLPAALSPHKYLRHTNTRELIIQYAET